MSEKNKEAAIKNEKTAQELDIAQKAFEQTRKRLDNKAQDLNDKERYLDYKASEIEKAKTKINQERATRVSANEDLLSLTDEQRKENFAAKKKLMKEHPIMVEPYLNSMCESYVSTKDETIKKEMLGDLYAIRKGDNTNAEKREMAKTFKRVLDKNPALQKDENLVALSKIDTIVLQLTKMIKKQIKRK